MNPSTQLVSFRLDGQRYALALADVVRVVGAAEIVSLPGAPRIVMGVLNVEGLVLPVINIRKRLRLPQRAIRHDEHFLIARTTRQTVVLLVDEALEVLECSPEDMIDTGEIVSGLEHISGVIILPDGLVVICNLDKFLSIDEEKLLNDAMRQETINGLPNAS